MEDRSHLTTEDRNPNSASFAGLSIGDAFDLINGEDGLISRAVAAAREDICRAIELVARCLKGGGRLIYVGAGTSGRLGMLDAVECPPTFLTYPEMVQCVIAGGNEALTRSVEGAEDSTAEAARAMDGKRVGAGDVVFGIAAGGTTPFVREALASARRRGAYTVFLACVPFAQAADGADVSIRVVVGPEVLAGSTRMKAGTATKMILNMVSTIAMARLGKVYQNFMVDVNTRASAKLADRGARIIRELTGCTLTASRALLEQAGGRVKTALVMRSLGVDCAAAERLLEEAGGRIDKVLKDRERQGPGAKVSPSCTKFGGVANSEEREISA